MPSHRAGAPTSGTSDQRTTPYRWKIGLRPAELALVAGSAEVPDGPGTCTGNKGWPAGHASG